MADLSHVAAYKGATILVTGGAGAIGSNLSRALAEAGAAKVVILDNLSASREWNIPNLPNVLFIHGDITNDIDLKRAFHEKPDYVFHLAAFFANQNSVDFPERDLLVSQLGTVKLLEYSILQNNLTTAGVVQIAQYILLASLLFGIYEAWARGGDTHFLGATAVRFFAVGLVMVNYGPAFRDVNGMFNNVANFINTSTAGGGDVFGQWMSDLSNYWNNNNGIQALWGMITGAFSGLLESLLLLVGYILFPITYALFSLFYALYGSILYVVGPFVLALYPAFGFGVMARKYLVNLMIFNAWGVLYSIFGADDVNKSTQLTSQ